MTSPIEKLMAEVDWKACPPGGAAPNQSDDMPYTTHEGVLEIGDMKLRCYRLSSGQAVLHAEDMQKYFGDVLYAL